MATNSLYQRHLVSITDFSAEEIGRIIQLAHHIKTQQMLPQSLQDRIVAHAFFEPSTRTRLSFESATLQLGGQAIGFSGTQSTSVSKGESLEDTIKVLGLYSNAIVIRHPENGAAERAANASIVPVINAGDGSNQHPTQTLLDLFTLWETQGRLDNLKLGLVGDLKYSRTIHSLIKALMLFGPQTFYCISPKALSLPDDLKQEAAAQGAVFEEETCFRPFMPELNALYMTRLQKERLPANAQALDFSTCQLSTEDLKHVKPYFKILHPLPRQQELPETIDKTPYAYYFEQAENGLYARIALLHALFSPTFEPLEQEE